jgi:tRNA (guanine-N7-)-methyltransferase
LQPYLLDLPEPAAPLSWPVVFGNDHPVEVEVGFGKGLFLLTAAQSCADVNFVGIEIERKYTLFTANRVAKRGLANLRLACGDARAFLRDRVAPASLRAVHVYFPDPWWKTRHRKRRVFTEEFAAACERALGPGGRLYVVTDVQDYFGVITELVARATRLAPLPPPDVSEPRHDLDYLTNFERKYRCEGRPIYRVNYQVVLDQRPTSSGA